ncbi:MAG TPA: PEP/pyruvate-binding domain-containing protein [Candidatus Saccharimonadales bacterium]|nr:PEP/pyruvate-binding domain-containing protein [Candidatus Saccharimonadales bacterium]
MSYIAFFKDITKADARRFGGKAASLGELTGAGLPVPEGFAIDVDAYSQFTAKPPDDKLEQELYEAFDKLGAARVAVRSSAVAEDAADASWAGQLESYLNVGNADLIQSVQKCWRSIDSRRAVEYAKDKQLRAEDKAVGVVVQKMLDSQKSGVMFSVHPVLKDKNTMVIESLYGLGEMIVQGEITPDNYVISKRPLKVLEFNIAVKEKQMVYKNGANRVEAVEEPLADRASLSEEDVLELAELGVKVEQHYGRPQDIEWAQVDGKFYILQSRPITTL